MSRVAFDDESNSVKEFNDDPGNQEIQKELTIEEEYELWKRNCPFMYDFVSQSPLTWPCLTVEWLPGLITTDSGSISQRLLLGTHTSGAEEDFLKLVSTQLPKSIIRTSGNKEAAEKDNEIKTSTSAVDSKLKELKLFSHDLEVNRVRYNPLNPSQVATISASGNVYVFNIDQEGSQTPIYLKHHTDNGYGLSWNSVKNGQLLTGSDDTTVALWDVTHPEKPSSVFKNHTDIVNDVQWQTKSANLFGSVSDDKTIKLYDSRDTNPIFNVLRDSPINTIAFSKHSSNLYAVGLEDSTIELFDIRNPTTKLHTIMGHSESISSLEWDPHNDGILASGSQDRRVILWDIKKIGEEQVQEDEDDGAPELFMMHAGHTSAVSDISFNPTIPWTLASTAGDNRVQLWKVSKKLTDEYYGIEESIDVYALE